LIFDSTAAGARAILVTRGQAPEVTFGRPSGPPASPRQVQRLLALLKEAGHTDFRDARGPMGFTQRQAGGSFTQDEAAAFIDRLRDNEPASVALDTLPLARHAAQQRLISNMPAEQLAVELRRRGWTVTEP
jgi:hypothetical protein